MLDPQHAGHLVQIWDQCNLAPGADQVDPGVTLHPQIGPNHMGYIYTQRENPAGGVGKEKYSSSHLYRH